MDPQFRREHHTAVDRGPCPFYPLPRMTAAGEGRISEPYDPLPDLIERAEHRPDGISQLKEVARLALSWHAPRLTWVTGGINSTDPETGEPLWSAATVCSCGTGEFPCPQRRWLTAIFGVEEDER